MAGLFIKPAGMSAEAAKDKAAIDICITDLEAALQSTTSAFTMLRYFSARAQPVKEEMNALVAQLSSGDHDVLARFRSVRERYFELLSWRTNAARLYCMDAWAVIQWMNKLKNLSMWAHAVRDTFDQDILAYCWPELDDWQYLKSLRDAAAHAAEHRLDRAQKKQTSQQEGLPEGILLSGESSIIMPFQLDGDRAIATWERKTIEFDCTEERYIALCDLRDRIFYALNVWPDHVRVNIFK